MAIRTSFEDIFLVSTARTLGCGSGSGSGSDGVRDGDGDGDGDGEFKSGLVRTDTS